LALVASDCDPVDAQILESFAIDDKFGRKRPQASDQLHPFTYAALAGLAFSLVLSACIFFSQKGYLELDLGVVSAIIFMMVVIPTVIHLGGRESQAIKRTGSVDGT
jgi:hypothetical protein